MLDVFLVRPKLKMPKTLTHDTHKRRYLFPLLKVPAAEPSTVYGDQGSSLGSVSRYARSLSYVGTAI